MSKAPPIPLKIFAHPLASPSCFNLQIIGAGRSTGAKGFHQAELKAAAVAVAAGGAHPDMTSPSCSSSSCILIPGKSPAKPERSLKRPGKSIQPAEGTQQHHCITDALRVLIVTGGEEAEQRSQGWV